MFWKTQIESANPFACNSSCGRLCYQNWPEKKHTHTHTHIFAPNQVEAGVPRIRDFESVFLQSASAGFMIGTMSTSEVPKSTLGCALSYGALEDDPANQEGLVDVPSEEGQGEDSLQSPMPTLVFQAGLPKLAVDARSEQWGWRHGHRGAVSKAGSGRCGRASGQGHESRRMRVLKRFV